MYFAELDQFMDILEKRFSKKQQQKPTGIVAKKVRKFGDPSTCPPPPGAPAWAIKHSGNCRSVFVRVFAISQLLCVDNRENENPVHSDSEELNDSVNCK